MRITTRGRLAVVAMVDVAVRGHAAPVALAGISRRHGISVSYLEQMFGQLRRAGLVSSTRGPGGGYQLARSASSITVADIVLAADSRAAQPQLGERIVHDATPWHCTAPELWAAVAEHAMAFLIAVSLQSILDQTTGPAAPEAGAGQSNANPAQSDCIAAPSPKGPNSVFALGKPAST